MNFSNLMLLDAASGAATGTSSLFIIVIYVAIFAVLYFVMLRPQRKEQKQKAQLLSQLAVGDSVRTTGGFIGTLMAYLAAVAMIVVGLYLVLGKEKRVK